METRIRKLAAAGTIKSGPAASGIWTDVNGKLKFSVFLNGVETVFEVPAVKAVSAGTAVTPTLAAATTLTAADSGRTFFLSAATEFDVLLPALAAGLKFRFFCKAAPSGASYTISSAGSLNNIIGTIHSSTGGNADSEAAGADTINFVDGAAVKGDRIDVECDGTNWYATCFCDADGGITITTAS